MVLNQSRRLSFAIFVGAFLWCAGFLAPPLLGDSAPGASKGLQAFYEKICHQIEDRSLHLNGVPFAVCGRCSSIYSGFLLGAAFLLLPGCASASGDFRALAILALFPMLLDVAGGLTGYAPPSMLSRLFTGGWFGFLSSFFLVPIAIGALEELTSRNIRSVADAR